MTPRPLEKADPPQSSPPAERPDTASAPGALPGQVDEVVLVLTVEDQAAAERVLAAIVRTRHVAGRRHKVRQLALGAAFTQAVEDAASAGAAWAIRLRTLATAEGTADWAAVLWSTSLAPTGPMRRRPRAA
jgi:hypothetical protein